MGINLYEIKLILQLRGQGYIPDRARVIEIGAQQLSNKLLRSRPFLTALSRAFGIATDPDLPEPSAPTQVAGVVEPLPSDAPLAAVLWKHLGLSYASIDIDGSPGSIPLDLNHDDVPGEHRMAYDVVTNFGTTEHVANQLNAFKIIHDLTQVGGVMIHNLPSQGYFNHGLVNYSPKFFWMLARSNDYEWLHFDFTHSSNYAGLPANVIESVNAFRQDIATRSQGYRFADASLIVALRRKSHADYVPPVDVPDSSMTRHEFSAAAVPEGFHFSTLTPMCWDPKIISLVFQP
jgi:hypothetical protein